jgi:hypothetical protein
MTGRALGSSLEVLADLSVETLGQRWPPGQLPVTSMQRLAVEARTCGRFKGEACLASAFG